MDQENDQETGYEKPAVKAAMAVASLLNGCKSTISLQVHKSLRVGLAVPLPFVAAVPGVAVVGRHPQEPDYWCRSAGNQLPLSP